MPDKNSIDKRDWDDDKDMEIEDDDFDDDDEDLAEEDDDFDDFDGEEDDYE